MSGGSSSERFEVRVVAANGSLGSGFRPESFERGLALKPHMIGCDAGSTDSGPAYLGGGMAKHSRAACKRDLRLMMLGRDRLGVPLIIGSCGTSGRDVGVNWMADIAREIAAEEALTFRMALIRTDQSAAYLKQRMAEGRIRPLKPAPHLDDSVIETSHVVGMMGTEPILAALGAGADIILAGRASDSALYAAVPIRMGAQPGLSWHAAKTIECGAACCVTPSPDGMIAYIRADHFEIEPLDPDSRVTPVTVAAHTLYENSNPYLLTEPSGVVDTEYADYFAASDRSVRVSGTKFHAATTYTIKLEGSQKIGYQTIVIGGMRDPNLIGMLDDLLAAALKRFDDRVSDLFGDVLKRGDYEIRYRVYGRDAVMGVNEPDRDSVPHEVGVLITITAPTQELATNIAKFVSHRSAHLPAPGYEGLISTLAYPFSPPEIERGAVYRFSLNHVLVPDNPLEMFRTELVQV
jgi:acyclic terpene utilization AtuA family protein